MAKIDCNINLSKRIDNERKTGEDSPAPKVNPLIKIFVDNQVDNARLKRLNDKDHKTIFKRIKDFYQKEFEIKYNAMNKEVEVIKDGKVVTTDHSFLRVELMAHANSSGESQEMTMRKIDNDFKVSKYDDNGNKLEGKKETLSQDKIMDIGLYTSARVSMSMNPQGKQMYYRDQWYDEIMHPEKKFTLEEQEQAMPMIKEIRLNIQDNIDLRVNQLTNIEKDDAFMTALYRFAKQNKKELSDNKLIKKIQKDLINETNDSKIKQLKEQLKEEQKRIRNLKVKDILKNISEVDKDNIRIKAEKSFEHNLKLHEQIQEEARQFSLNKNFEDFLKFSILPDAKARVVNDPQTLEAYNNIERSYDEIRERAKKEYLSAGKKIGNMFNNNDSYMKVVVQEVTNPNKYENGISPLGSDLSMFVGQKGSTKDILSDIRLSSYLFHLGMEKAIFSAKIFKELSKTNIANEILSLVTDQAKVANTNVNERLLDKIAMITPTEQKQLKSASYKFNQLINQKYDELHIDESDIRTKRKFRDKNSEIQEGSVNEEIQSNIKIALENEKNQLKNSYLEGEFDKFFKLNPYFSNVERFLDEKTEDINTKTLYKFAETVNSTADFDLNKQNTLMIKNLVDVNSELNYNILGGNRIRLNKLLDMYRNDEKGNERYALVDMMGNRIGYNAEGKLGSMFMEDFDHNDPTKFAEWLAMSMFIDADANLTTDFLEKDKVMMVPTVVADTLAEMKTNLNPEKSHWLLESLKPATSIAKVGMLYNPFSVVGYNMRNAIDDARAAFIAQPQAFKEIFTDKDIFNDVFDYALGKKTSQEFIDFLRHTDTFNSLHQDEIMRQFKVSNVGKLAEVRERIANKKAELNVQVENGTKSALIAGQEYFRFGLKWYMSNVTHASSVREMFLRYAVYKSKIKEFTNTYNENGIASTENWGASKWKIIQNILDEGNAETNQEQKEYIYKVAAMEYANQSIISYRDASHFVDGLSRWAIPFARYSEGNVRRFSRLMENFVHDTHDNFKKYQMGDYSKSDLALKQSKTLGIAALRGSAVGGIPMLLFNAAMLALMGMDYDDIADYQKENGFTMTPNILHLFGYDQVLMINNSDNFAEMLSMVGLDEINYKLQDALYHYGEALLDEDLETNLLTDMLEAFTSSEIHPFEAFLYKGLGMSNPFVKLFPEQVFGIDFYPEGPVGVGYKYSPMQNIVRKSVSLVGLGKAYTIKEQFTSGFWDRVFGKQDYMGTPRGTDFFESFGIKSIGTKQDAWQQQRSLAYTYSQDVLGKEPFSRSGYGDERDYMRDEIYQQLKYGRYDNAQTAINNYITYLSEQDYTNEELTKEMESLRRSLKSRFDVIPSNAIPQKEMQGYIDTLSQQQINDLLIAYEYQKEILGPYYEWIFGN